MFGLGLRTWGICYPTGADVGAIVKEAIADTDSAHRLRFDPLNLFLILAITCMAILAISLLYVV